MRDNSQFWQLATRFQSLLVLVLMIVTMSLLSDRFLTQANGLNIMRQISVNVCLSIGMTMVILSGGIDLSVGSVLAFSGAITAGLIKSAIPMTWLGVEFQFTTGGAILAGLSVGVLLGWFNGQMITRLKIPPFVATLGMLSIARGMTMLWTKGFPITGLGDGFAFIGTGSVLGLPVPVWVAASLVGLSALFTKKMKLGRYICRRRQRTDRPIIRSERQSHQGHRIHTRWGFVCCRWADHDVATRLGSAQRGHGV